MSTADDVIRRLIREELADFVNSDPGVPELISVEAAAEFCDGVDRSVILNLHRDRHNNGFPSVQLGPKTIKIDKRRLAAWFQSGGLAG